MIFVAVDWSGARRPAGKIWLAEALAGTLQRLEPVSSRADVVRYVSDYGSRGIAAVVGLDFSFSLPAWFCRHLGAADAVELWGQVAANGDTWLASCQWPFWGRPGKRRPELPAHFRRTEERVGARLRTKPKSTFQIGGAGAVGTGS